MNKINLQFTIEEVNKILESLSNMPYKEVYGVIENVRTQASSQMEETEQKEAPKENK